jgi:hypothetical protein
MVKKYGQEVVDALMARQHETKQWTREELLELKDYYNERIKSIRAGRLPVGSEAGDGLSMSDMFSNLPEPESVPPDPLQGDV